MPTDAEIIAEGIVSQKSNVFQTAPNALKTLDKVALTYSKAKGFRKRVKETSQTAALLSAELKRRGAVH